MCLIKISLVCLKYEAKVIQLLIKFAILLLHLILWENRRILVLFSSTSGAILLFTCTLSHSHMLFIHKFSILNS